MTNLDKDEFVRGILHGFSVTFLALLLLFVLCGCRTTKYVPVETVRTEYRQADTTAIYNSILRLLESRKEKESRYDSISDREKVTVVINEQGDTTRHDRERIVYRATARERELEVENKTLRDSISVLSARLESVRVDSISVPYPVERKLTKWEKVKMDTGGFMLGSVGVLVVALMGVVVWLVRVKRRK